LFQNKLKKWERRRVRKEQKEKRECEPERGWRWLVQVDVVVQTFLS